jgi:hypothetical protein
MKFTVQPAFRYRWFLLIFVAAAAMALGGFAIQGLGAGTQDAPRGTPIPVASSVDVKVAPFGVSLRVPENWKSPVVLDADSFILSPDGSTDTRTTAGPFLYVVVDALKVFGRRLNFRADLDDPVAQLGALVSALNRQGAAFGDAAVYQGAVYPAAMVRGSERDKVLTIVLLRAGDNRWIYAGALAKADQFAYLEQTVFKPAVDSLTLGGQ